jgi:hypothetical protein
VAAAWSPRARPLPYDLAFANADFEHAHFPAIQAEAARLGGDPSTPEQFLQLPGVAAILRSTLVEENATDVEQFGPLLFQAFHFWRFGKCVFELDEAVLRYLLAQSLELEPWELRAPAVSGYLRLPRHIMWARIHEDAAAEAVDGLFWTQIGRRLETLLILGLLPGRPGFSVAHVMGDTGQVPDQHWGNVQVRETQPDFANVLPGGELQHLHAIETMGEVLKLVARIFWYIAQHPEAVQDGGANRKQVSLHG